MKWLQPIAGVANEILRMFQQVDRLFQKTNTQLYKVKITFENQIYTVKVSDGEGNAVDGAIVNVWMHDPSATMSSTVGDFYLEPATTFPDGYKMLMVLNSATTTYKWRSIIMRIPRDGIKLKISDNPRATLRACVIGKEFSLS